MPSKIIDGNAFAKTFASNCQPNFPTKTIKANLNLSNNLANYNPLDPITPNIEVERVEHFIKEMKKNKSPGKDGITVEHLINAHPCVTISIARLLNLMFIHEHLPMHLAVVSHILFQKEKTNTSTHSADYRGMSINPVISKIFEYCLLEKYQHYLSTSEQQQFGFKPGIGCNHAIYSMTKPLSTIQIGAQMSISVL